MKRILLGIGIGLGVLVLAAGVLIGSLFIGLQGMPEDFELNGVRLVRDGFVGVGLVQVGPDEVALIDAGNDSSGAAILAELSSRGLGPEAVTAIFITHGHPDHVSGAPVFPNAEVMSLAADADLVAGRARSSNLLSRVMPLSPTGVEVTRILNDGEVVQVGDTSVRVYALPGHTAGSAAYLVNGVLFLGDGANASSDAEVEGPRWVVSEDQTLADSSLVDLEKRLRQENAQVEAIVFAHSGPLTAGLEPLTAFAQADQ